MEENYKDIFKREFDRHEDEIDPQIIWDQIQSKKKKRRFFIIPLFGIGALGLILFLVFFKSDQTQNAATEISEKHKSPKVELKDFTDSKKETSQVENKTISPKDSQKINQTESDSQNKELPQASNESSIRKKEIKINSKRTVLENTRVEQTENQIDKINKKENTKVVQDIKIEQQQIFASKEINSSEANIAKKNVNKIELTMLHHLELSQLVVEDRDKVSMILNYVAEPKVNEESSEEEPSTKETKSYWALSAHGDYGLLSTTVMSPDFDAVDARSSTVSSLEAARTNLLVDFHCNELLSFSTGVQYTRVNELFVWQGSYLEPIMAVNTDTVIVRRNMQIYNKTHLVSVPLIVNLSRQIGNFSATVSGGVEANVLQWRDGFVLGEDDIPIALQDQNVDFGLNYLAKLRLQYQVSERIGLSANMSQVFIRSDETNISTRHRITGLGLGLHYKLM